MSRRRGKKVGLHHHRCTACGRRYEDTCSQVVVGKRGGRSVGPGRNGPCPECRTGNPNPWWYEGREPRDCCYANARLANSREEELYRLAGASRWWICPICWRTQPNDPRKRSRQ